MLSKLMVRVRLVLVLFPAVPALPRGGDEGSFSKIETQQENILHMIF